MSATLFHCTFSDRDMTGHVHQYNDSWRILPYVYVACITLNDNNSITVVGGAVIQTDVHHTDKEFKNILVNNLIQCPDFQNYKTIPFTLRPFQVSRLASDFPLAEHDYYELLFEKYLELCHFGKLPS